LQKNFFSFSLMAQIYCFFPIVPPDGVKNA
jgi:hypothetical protein